MKSLKKTLVLLVVFSMILSSLVPAFAATDTEGTEYAEEVARLEALDVINGYEDGTFKPENTITRAEMAVILCKMVGIDAVTVEESKDVPSKFSDVKAGEWYTGYVNVAAGKKLISGYPDGTFRPNDPLTMNHVLTLCVKALGRGDYVDKMGTWPANYIAEAAKLGLTDGVHSSDANRGNVAMIVWNTLETPAVWDVDNTEFEGTINLGESDRSLLSIYFRDFICEDNELLLKELEYVSVVATPSTDPELGENQIVLAEDTKYTDGEVWKEILATKLERGTDEEEATYGDDDLIVAYAPEFEGLNDLYGKVVTVIFGKDNEVVSIRIVDEIAEEFLTAWEDDKLEIGGTNYKFAKNAEIYMNTIKMEDMDEVFEILGIEDPTDYHKTIKATVVLNNSGKVTRLDLNVSGNYVLAEGVNTNEAIVSKVRNEVITMYSSVSNAIAEIDYSEGGKYEEEDEQPRVIKDNAFITLEEIAVGDVLTYITVGDAIKTIYVSSNKVTGELTKTSKEDFRLKVNDTNYYSSMEKMYVTDEKVADKETIANADKYIGEEVELYLNILGEYVLMVAGEGNEDWTFGIVTRVNDIEEDEEDEDIFYLPVRILLADGNISREYKFILDEEDDKLDSKAWESKIEKLEDRFIVFAANANKEIEEGDYAKVDEKLAEVTDNAYEAIKVIAGKANIDDDNERIEKKSFTNKTVIFNTGKGDKATVSSDWDLLITKDEELAYNAIIIMEEDAKTISYIGIDVAEKDYTTSDALYAIVAEDDYKEGKGSQTKRYVDLLLADDEEATKFEAKKLNPDNAYAAGEEGNFVEYTLSGDKLETVTVLVNVEDFDDLKNSEEVTTEISSSKETKLFVEAPKYVVSDSGLLVVPNEEDDPDFDANTQVKLATVVETLPEAEIDDEVAKVSTTVKKHTKVASAGAGVKTVVADLKDTEIDSEVVKAATDIASVTDEMKVVKKDGKYVEALLADQTANIKTVVANKGEKELYESDVTNLPHVMAGVYVKKDLETGVYAEWTQGDSEINKYLVVKDLESNEVTIDTIEAANTEDTDPKFVAGDKVVLDTAKYRAARLTDEKGTLVVNVLGSDEIYLKDVNASEKIEPTNFVKEDDETVVSYKMWETADASNKYKVVKGLVANKAEAGEITLADANISGLELGASPVYVTENTDTFVAIKANFKVIDTLNNFIQYEDDEDEVGNNSFDEIEVDEDVIVYDLRNADEIVTMTFAELKDLIAEEDLYVIPFANSDAEEDTANILVIVK